MSYYFSAERGGFISAAFKVDGTYTEQTWPIDAVLCTDKEVETYRGRQAPDGKILGSKKGRPAWVDVPPLTHEQYIAVAESQKQALIAEVHAETEMFRAKLALGRISDDEKMLLNSWLDYLDVLEAVDVSTVPDIIWPVKP